MPRTTPVNAGYTIVNGSGTGTNGERIHVWAEYLVGEADINGNCTWLSAYFYAALDPNYTSSTSYYKGLDSTFSVDGSAANGITDGAYDFTDPAKVNLLGSFGGWVTHGADGKKTVALEGAFTTASSYISGGSVSATVTLPDIVQRARPTAESIFLGEPCRITWTPSLATHSFLLTFYLGNWTYSTEMITPGVTSAYTYTDLTLPLTVAQQFSSAVGRVTVMLDTYDGNTLLGSETDVFYVTVQENGDTRPVITGFLQPEGTAFPGRYVQLVSKVSAQVTAEDPLGGEITDYTISTGGNVIHGTTSEYLDRAGAVTVTVTAKNSRGFTGVWQEQIQVIPYEPPRLLSAKAYRCRLDGTADPEGTQLRLEASWSHSAVEGENTCILWWQYQGEGEDWSQWQSVHTDGYVDTGPISGVTLRRDKTYVVAVEAWDTAGGTSKTRISIPGEKVYMHRKKDAMGLGGHVQESDMLDVHWDLQARQSINGAYIRTGRLFATTQMQVQTKFSALDGDGSVRQSIWLFGNDNGLPVQGVICISDNGGVQWDGTSGITLSADNATGMVTITFPYTGYDRFVFLSPDPIALVQ